MPGKMMKVLNLVSIFSDQLVKFTINLKQDYFTIGLIIKI